MTTLRWGRAEQSISTRLRWGRAEVGFDLPSTNLLLRFKADDLSGADNSAVSSWSGSGSAASPAVQATVANQPKLRTAAVNGHNAVEFDGVNDMLALQTTALGTAQNKGALTLFICYKMPASAVTNTRSLIALSTGTTTGARAAVQQNVTGTNAHQAAGRRLDADGFGSVSGSGSGVGEVGVLTAIFDWTNKTLTLLKNGVQVAQSTNFQTVGSTSNTASLTGFIGANANGSAEWFQGQITEIIAYETADADSSVRNAVHPYLFSTYGIAPSKLRWGRAAQDGTVNATGKLRWARSTIDGTPAVVVNALTNQSNIEPNSSVMVRASLSDGGTADSWAWRVISGPTVTLYKNGPNVAFDAPSALTGTSVVLGVIATVAGIQSTERSCTITVLPQTEWWWNGVFWDGADIATDYDIMLRMPTTPPAGETFVWKNDFLQNFAEGQAITQTSGDTGKLNPTSVAGQAYAEGGTSGAAWKAKERLSIPPGEPNTRYDAQTTMSASNSVVRIRNQRLSDGTLRAGALKPIFGNGVDFNIQTTFEWCSWSDGVAGFSYVFDFIGDSADWAGGGGELGFPENGVASTDAHIFFRWKNGPTNGPVSITSGFDPHDRHVYRVTWIPGVAIIGWIDGKVRLIERDPNRVWTSPKRWLLQSGGSSTTTGAEGSVYVDWIVISQAL